MSSRQQRLPGSQPLLVKIVVCVKSMRTTKTQKPVSVSHRRASCFEGCPGRECSLLNPFTQNVARVANDSRTAASKGPRDLQSRSQLVTASFCVCKQSKMLAVLLGVLVTRVLAVDRRYFIQAEPVSFLFLVGVSPRTVVHESCFRRFCGTTYPQMRTA